MKKNLFRWLIALAVVLPCLLISASAASGDIIDSGYCGGEGDGTNLTWTLYGDGELVIDGTGAMANYFQNAPWAAYNFFSVTIGDGVTTIGTEAFRNHINLIKATIGDDVTKIGDRAFKGCSALKNVTIGKNVTSIGSAGNFLSHPVPVFINGLRVQF